MVTIFCIFFCLSQKTVPHNACLIDVIENPNSSFFFCLVSTTLLRGFGTMSIFFWHLKKIFKWVFKGNVRRKDYVVFLTVHQRAFGSLLRGRHVAKGIALLHLVLFVVPVPKLI